MMIESLNIESKGLLFKGLRKTKFGQVVVAALLGSVPGCMGGFATVSLYTHRMFSFGALVAMMIASSGDEAFVMLAMIPEQALILFAVLFVIAVIVGYLTDKIWDYRHNLHCHKLDHEECGEHADCEGYELHEEEHQHDVTGKKVNEVKKRHMGWRRIVMFVGLAVFIGALATGRLGHDHSAHEHSAHSQVEEHAHLHESQTEAACHDECCHHHVEEGHHHMEEGHHHMKEGHNHVEEGHHHVEEGHHHEAQKGLSINLLSEDWMNVLFAGLSVIMLFVLLLGSDHFVEEHMWNHIIKKHLPTIFAWTFGVLLVVGTGLQYIEIDRWISDNTALMIVLATLIGIIPESGPHMIFITLYAAGVVPMPVLLASCISQDGHASIPLLAESKKSFAWAKLINCIVALAAGFAAMLFM